MNIRKVLILILSLFLVFSLIGCGSNNGEDQLSEEESENEEPETNEGNLTDEDDGESTPKEVIAALEEESQEKQEESQTEENVNNNEEENQEDAEEYVNYFYHSAGNTSGNLANKGYTAYNFNTGNHIISMNMGVYSFNPKDESVKELFNLDDLSSAKYLNTTDEWLYYINMNNGNVVRRRIDD